MLRGVSLRIQKGEGSWTLWLKDLGIFSITDLCRMLACSSFGSQFLRYPEEGICQYSNRLYGLSPSNVVTDGSWKGCHVCGTGVWIAIMMHFRWKTSLMDLGVYRVYGNP